jgi:bacteriocin-like protein
MNTTTNHASHLNALAMTELTEQEMDAVTGGDLLGGGGQP